MSNYFYVTIILCPSTHLFVDLQILPSDIEITFERKSFKITKVLTTRQLKQILIDDDDVADIEKKKCTSSSS